MADGEEHADEREEHHDGIVDEGVVLAEPDVIVHEEDENEPQIPRNLGEMGLFLE